MTFPISMGLDVEGDALSSPRCTPNESVRPGTGRLRRRATLHALDRLGSLRETDYFLLLAFDLGYLSEEECHLLNDKADETARTLAGLMDSVRSNS